MSKIEKIMCEIRSTRMQLYFLILQKNGNLQDDDVQSLSRQLDLMVNKYTLSRC
jgi:hypothetical protein